MALRGKGKKQDWAGGRLDIFPACPTVSAEQAGSFKEPRVGGNSQILAQQSCFVPGCDHPKNSVVLARRLGGRGACKLSPTFVSQPSL